MDHQNPTPGPPSNGESNGSIAKSCYRSKIKYNNKSELCKKKHRVTSEACLWEWS